MDAFCVNPRLEARLDQLGDGRTRHQHPFVDIELMPGKPHAMREICHRYALVDAPLEQLQHLFALPRAEFPRINFRRIFVLQTGTEEHQLCGLIERIIGAMSKPEVGRAEQLCSMADQVFDGAQLGHSGHGRSLIRGGEQGDAVQ